MARDLEQTFGVTRTIVKNLTGASYRLRWWPERYGEGRSIAAHERIVIEANLFEEIYAKPHLLAALQEDTTSGRIAISACGTPPEDADGDNLYAVLDDQTQPGWQTHGCTDWEWNSSSSAWIEG